MTRLLSRFELQLCDIQGRLFELALKHRLDSADFIEKFMNSETCRYFDLPYDRHQWHGEEYILECVMDESEIRSTGALFGTEAMYWIGYVYRYWHLLTGEGSREIYRQAGAKQMRECYPGFHTVDVVLAIEWLKEIHEQRTQAG